MIYINNRQWKTLTQPIYNGKRTIKKVYAGSHKVYPSVAFDATSLSGVCINNEPYLIPLRMYIPGTCISDYEYGETISPANYEPIITRQYVLGEGTVAQRSVYTGIHLIGENIDPTYETGTISRSTSSFKRGSFTLRWGKGRGEESTTRNNTITVPYVGDTYANIAKPVLNRYMLVGGWIEDGYENLLPSWLTGYTESSQKPGVSDYPEVSEILTMAGKLKEELFLQPIILPDGAESIVFTSMSTPKDPGMFKGFGPRLNNKGYIVPSTDLISIEGYGTGFYECGLTNANYPAINPPLLYSGKNAGGSIGDVGTCFGLDGNGDLLWTIPGSIGIANGYAGYAEIDIKSGTKTVGIFYITIDNVITKITTEKDFLWYQGIYTGN